MAWVIYYCVFKGYFKIIVDLPLLSFYKTQDLKKIMNEKDVFYNHMTTLANVNGHGINPYKEIADALSTVHGTDANVGDVSNIGVVITSIFDTIQMLPDLNKIPSKHDQLFAFLEKYYNFKDTLSIDAGTTKARSFHTFKYHVEEIKDPGVDPRKLPQCDAIITDKIINPDLKTQPCPAPYFKISNLDYDLYRLIYKQLYPDKKSPSELQILNLYYFDNTYYWTADLVTEVETQKFHNDKRTNYKESLINIRNLGDQLSKLLRKVAENMEHAAFIHLLHVPMKSEESISVAQQLHMYKNVIWSNDIYNNDVYVSAGSINIKLDASVKKLDEQTWYVIEALRNNEVYVNYDQAVVRPSGVTYTSNIADKYMMLSQFADALLQSNVYLLSFLTSYMAQPARKRLALFAKVPRTFPNDMLPKALPQYQGMDDGSVLRHRMDLFKKKYVPIIAWFEKHPVFTHIYLNANIPKDIKPRQYQAAIQTYTDLLTVNANKTRMNARTADTSADYTTLIDNLVRNGSTLKDVISAIVVLDLYFNVYKKDMITMFKDQNMSQADFRYRIWNQFFVEIWVKRVLEYYKQIFAPSYMTHRFKQFEKLWNLLGTLIEKAKKNISSSFKPHSREEINKAQLAAENTHDTIQPDTSSGE